MNFSLLFDKKIGSFIPFCKVHIKSHRPIGGILIFYPGNLPPAPFALVPLPTLVEPGLYTMFAPTFRTSRHHHLHEDRRILSSFLKYSLFDQAELRRLFWVYFKRGNVLNGDLHVPMCLG